MTFKNPFKGLFDKNISKLTQKTAPLEAVVQETPIATQASIIEAPVAQYNPTTVETPLDERIMQAVTGGRGYISGQLVEIASDSYLALQERLGDMEGKGTSNLFAIINHFFQKTDNNGVRLLDTVTTIEQLTEFEEKQRYFGNNCGYSHISISGLADATHAQIMGKTIADFVEDVRYFDHDTKAEGIAIELMRNNIDYKADPVNAMRVVADSFRQQGHSEGYSDGISAAADETGRIFGLKEKRSSFTNIIREYDYIDLISIRKTLGEKPTSEFGRELQKRYKLSSSQTIALKPHEESRSTYADRLLNLIDIKDQKNRAEIAEYELKFR